MGEAIKLVLHFTLHLVPHVKGKTNPASMIVLFPSNSQVTVPLATIGVMQVSENLKQIYMFIFII